MNINYLLLFNGYSNSGGPESSVRCFVKLEAAQAAMTESYRKYAAALNIPAGHGRPRNQYTTETKSGIRLKHYGDFFNGILSRLHRRMVIPQSLLLSSMGCKMYP